MPLREVSSNTRLPTRSPVIKKVYTTERIIAIRIPLRKPLEASSNILNTNKASYNPTIIVTLEPSNRLIYYTDKATSIRRLYIPATVIKDILTVAYTIEGYIGFTRYYERIAGSWYIRRLIRYLRDYLKHYPEYLVY